MYKQKQQFGVRLINQIGSGFLFGIMFLLPSLVFASTSNVDQNIVTSNRTWSTIYQNGSSTPLFVAANLYDTVNGISFNVYTGASTSSLHVVTACTSQTIVIANCFFVVPANWYYEIIGAGVSSSTLIVNWTEWHWSDYSPTNVVVDNPNQDFAFGIFFFLIAMLGMITWFKNSN